MLSDLVKVLNLDCGRKQLEEITGRILTGCTEAGCGKEVVNSWEETCMNFVMANITIQLS